MNRSLLIGFCFAGIAGSQSYALEFVNVMMEGDGRKAHVEAEVVDTFEERQQGLMHRKELPADKGMLFKWEKSERRAFWMKDTLIPLDIIFIKKNKVVAIHPRAKPLDDALISPEVESDLVLEVNGGWAERQGMKEGAVITVTPVPHF